MSTSRIDSASSLPASSLKAIVSVADMARMCALSRARFYELMHEGVFPAPKRNPETKRPFYDAEGQASCLKVRTTNCGINARPVLFYARRLPPTSLPPRPPRRSSAQTKQKATSRPLITDAVQGLLDGLRQLGLDSVTSEQVLAARASCFPDGVQNLDEATVLGAVFRLLTRRNSGGNVGR